MIKLAIFIYFLITLGIFSDLTEGQRVLGDKTEEIITENIRDNNEENFIIDYVVDGDTVKLSTGEKLRYIGIDTPETKHPNKPIECYGQQAYQKNKELVEGKVVELEKDVSEVDRYDRLLRYVYVDGVMINELLVKEGYAKASSYPPDIKYQDRFRQAEEEARTAKRGLWSDICL